MDAASPLPDLVPGDWVHMKYGFDRLEFYVLRVSAGSVCLGKRDWLVSSSMWFKKSELRDAEYLGRTKVRWWWRLLPWNDLWCPFYKLASAQP